MALQKQGINIPFGQGVDTKTDKTQVAMGKMLDLRNAVFDRGGSLTKRNGFPLLTTLPNTQQTTLTTLNDNLIATGSSLYAYSEDTNQWLNQGTVQPVDLHVQPMVRTSKSQSKVDSVTAPNGLCCLVFYDGADAKYQVSDASTGQVIVAMTALPATATNPRVFLLGNYFIITFGATVAAAAHLQYIAIPINNLMAPSSATDLSTSISAIGAAYDGYVANNNLYIAFNGSDVGGAIRVLNMSSTFVVSATKIIAGYSADLISVTADISGSTAVIWVTWWETTGNDGYTTALNQNRLTLLAPTQVINNEELISLTSVATNSLLTVVYEIDNDYSYAAIQTDYLKKLTCTQSGTVSTSSVIRRSLGLASKAFIFEGTIYFLAAYGQTFQPTYFLLNSSGSILAKLAYSNGAGYMTSQVLPSISIVDANVYCSYLIKDLLVSVNKEQGVASAAGIYSQTGINLATFNINQAQQYSSEIASSLHLTGGYLWQYDSVKPVEHSFHVWPEDLVVSTSGVGGNISAQQYFYAFCYEWTDAQGLLHRSAPSVPASITTVGATSTNTINVPTLRLTAKTGSNPVRLVGYRWSTAQPIYYQFTSISNPIINDTSVDSIAVIDTLADSSILGNTILYTTGGVLENIAAPSCSASTLYKNRLWLVDAEDRNLLWYSKQVISGTPVEMSDLLTYYVAPTSGAQGSTGPIQAISAMDDKLIIFKKDAIYYVTGTGPDNTGASNDLSDPVFITSTVGCSNPKSIVFSPLGIMFQSDKGIWLLGRDLSTKYIGADVEAYNTATVMSSLTIPATNQVRFTLSDGTVLMYDYYFNQWCTFTGIPGISATLYQRKHTYLNENGQVFKESIGSYLDNSRPVVMGLSTSWIKLTDLQGFQRAYFLFLLSEYKSPHKLNIKLAYDYDDAIQQSTIITPTNFSPAYGLSSPYGGASPYGGPSSVEQWRVFLNKQKCQAIKVSIDEIYDPTLGIEAGAGLSLSAINMVIGAKAGYPKLPSSQSA